MAWSLTGRCPAQRRLGGLPVSRPTARVPSTRPGIRFGDPIANRRLNPALLKTLHWLA
jgi:hypothetical protein